MPIIFLFLQRNFAINILNYLSFMKTIKIQVFRFEAGNMKILYRNTVEVPDSLDFPFAKVESTLRLLYMYAEGVSF